MGNLDVKITFQKRHFESQWGWQLYSEMGVMELRNCILERTFWKCFFYGKCSKVCIWHFFYFFKIFNYNFI